HAQGALNFLQEQQDLLAGGAVEIAGGLVGEENSGAIHQGAGERSALLFASGELAGAMLAAGAQADALKGFRYAGAALGAIDFGKTQRELYIFFESHARQQVEGLKDHAYGVAAVPG